MMELIFSLWWGAFKWVEVPVLTMVTSNSSMDPILELLVVVATNLF